METTMALYTKKNLIEMNTGGGCMVDFIMNPQKNMVLFLNNDGYNKLTIENYDNFLLEIEEKREEIKREWASSIDIYNDEEIAWLLLDIMQENFEFKTVKYNYFEEFLMEDAQEYTIWYEELKTKDKADIIEQIFNDTFEN